ncbi:alkaline phosphatase family protein [Candidatus Fermentibacteria bacterium]|nr:alkaline phosphatase family protein [Candidatus Fermentibacteria bacterium]
MTSPLVLILVDGLRYADHPTPGKLMPQLGFRDVEASIFTGVSVAAHQWLTDYVFSEQSPFEAVCRIPGIDLLWHSLTPRHRRYLNFLLYRISSSLNHRILPRSSLIPPRFLRHVAPAFSSRPDESGAFGDTESLFDVLRQMGKAWLFAAPPRISPWGATDCRVEAFVFRSFAKGLRDFYFIKLGDLDKVSHRFGPSSTQAAHCRAVTARRIANVLGEMQSRAPGLRIVIFSDHGFLPVSRCIRPPQWLDEVAGQGGIRYFIDSTMVRIKYAGGAETPRLPPAPPDMVPLSETDRESFGLAWGSPQLGNHAWLAPPGAVFWPDFFCAAPPAGMHGYLPHPECACPLEIRGFARMPSVTTHAELGAWLKEVVAEG